MYKHYVPEHSKFGLISKNSAKFTLGLKFWLENIFCLWLWGLICRHFIHLSPSTVVLPYVQCLVCVCEQEAVQPPVWCHDQHLPHHLQQSQLHGEGQAGPDCGVPATPIEAGHPPPHPHLHRLSLHQCIRRHCIQWW